MRTRGLDMLGHDEPAYGENNDLDGNTQLTRSPASAGH
jgi:hypothetical protein